VHRVTLRPNTLVTVPAGCIMVTLTFMFSPVVTSFIRDRKDYLIDHDWTESYKSIIGELDTHALARVQSFGASERASSRVDPKLFLYLFLPSC
jgi:hypothetical protein